MIHDPTHTRPRVIIETPFAGKGRSALARWLSQRRHVVYARQCMLDSLSRGEAPFLSHLLYTQVLDDRIQAERQAGISAGLVWGEVAELTAVYVDFGVSGGMVQGIRHAWNNKRKVEYRAITDAGRARLRNMGKSYA